MANEKTCGNDDLMIFRQREHLGVINACGRYEKRIIGRRRQENSIEIKHVDDLHILYSLIRSSKSNQSKFLQNLEKIVIIVYR